MGLSLAVMVDFRPVAYVVGLLLMALGATMVVPLAADVYVQDGNAGIFATAAFLTAITGGWVALASRQEGLGGLNLQQTFLLTTLVWVFLPIFGALPFWLGNNGLSYTDAFFEAMSGLTTTGSTVYEGLETLPAGILLWRGMLQWFGGVGIIVVAMAFLPMLKVGGMQLFRSESFDTFGKILPRAAEIASSIWRIYLVLTLTCALGYTWAGMGFLDAATHAMTTIATGGFANHDDSFGFYGAKAEYVSVLFMLLASLPFVRYVQLLAGTAVPLYRDTQIRAFFMLVFIVVGLLAAWQAGISGRDFEVAFRKSLFNGVSILTGTGYASEDYGLWGDFPVVVFFLIGLVGGCAGSTCCSIKVFRFQLLASALYSQIRRIHSPNGIFTPKYEGRPVADDVFSSLMAFFVMFLATLLFVAITMSLLGEDFITSISGAATALANIGPGLGPKIGPSGNFADLSDAAKWLLSATMLIGRLELLSVYVLFTVTFWRR